MTPKKLTAKQEAFAEHYALHKSPSAAYRHAYPVANKWKPQQVAVEAQKLINNPRIARRIEALSAKVNEIAEKKFEVTVERVLDEFATIAFSNADDYFEWGTRPVYKRDKAGNFEYNEAGDKILLGQEPFVFIKPSEKLTRRQKAAIVGASMTFSRTGEPVTEVKLGDKIAALTALGKHLGMFKEIKEVTGKNGRPIEHSVALPDLSQTTDPTEALRQFEALRSTLHTAGNA